MIRNRIEFITGRRWAASVVESSLALLSTTGGRERMIATLHRGTIEKPESYAAAVREFITEVEDVLDVQALSK